MTFPLVDLLAAVAVGFPGAAAFAQDTGSGAVQHLAAHPFPAASWRAAYVYDCPERKVGFTLAVDRGKATVSALDLGAASTTANADKINAALAGFHFDKLLVTCAAANASITFVGWEAREDDTLGAQRLVTVQSSSPSIPALSVEAR